MLTCDAPGPRYALRIPRRSNLGDGQTVHVPCSIRNLRSRLRQIDSQGPQLVGSIREHRMKQIIGICTLAIGIQVQTSNRRDARPASGTALVWPPAVSGTQGCSVGSQCQDLGPLQEWLPVRKGDSRKLGDRVLLFFCHLVSLSKKKAMPSP